MIRRLTIATFVVAALLLIGAELVRAQTCAPAPADPIARDAARLTWERPTQWEDGSTLPTTEPLTYTLYREGAAVCTTTEVSAGDLGLPVGESCWVVTAKTATSAESDPSNQACKTIAAPRPAPPSGLTVSAENPIAYELILSRDRVAFNVVGAVPAGTACDPSQPIGAYHVVPRSAVIWAGSAQPQTVVAQCVSF